MTQVSSITVREKGKKFVGFDSRKQTPERTNHFGTSFLHSSERMKGLSLGEGPFRKRGNVGRKK